MSKVFCPYCGNEMNYTIQTNGVNAQIALFKCPNCKAKTPQVNAPFTLPTIANLDDNAVEAEELEVGITESASDEIAELHDQVYNLTLYLNNVEREHPSVFAELMKKFDGMPGYSGVVQ